METVTYDVEQLMKIIDETEVCSAEDIVDLLNSTECCVGGALCRQVNMFDFGFPSYGVLSDVLRTVNPRLSENLAISYADNIVVLNDKYLFKEAKQKMREALTWKP